MDIILMFETKVPTTFFPKQIIVTELGIFHDEAV